MSEACEAPHDLDEHMLYRVESYKERWHAFGMGDADLCEHFSDDDADFPHGCDFDVWAGGRTGTPNVLRLRMRPLRTCRRRKPDRR